jgi:YesN/AraC family two-component response regulator
MFTERIEMDGKIRILVVDDEPGMRLALKKTLEKKGYLTSEASNGKEALILLGEKTFDLMIADIKMPCLNGVDLLKVVRTKHSELPVILITAYPSVDNAVLALREDADDYLIKPFGQSDLSKSIAKVLGKKEKALRRSKDKKLPSSTSSSKTLFASIGLNELAIITLQMSLNLFRADVAEIWLKDENSAELKPLCSRGAKDNRVKSSKVEIKRLTKEVSQANKVFVIEDRERFLNNKKGSQPLSYCSQLCIPLLNEDVLFGLLNIYFTEKRSFSSEDIHLAAGLGDSVAQAFNSSSVLV